MKTDKIKNNTNYKSGSIKGVGAKSVVQNQAKVLIANALIKAKV